jgi:hypothetical protein
MLNGQFGVGRSLGMLPHVMEVFVRLLWGTYLGGCNGEELAGGLPTFVMMKFHNLCCSYNVINGGNSATGISDISWYNCTFLFPMCGVGRSGSLPVLTSFSCLFLPTATCSFYRPAFADDLFHCCSRRIPSLSVPWWSCDIFRGDHCRKSLPFCTWYYKCFRWRRQFSDTLACSILGFSLPPCRFLRAILIFCATGNITW